MAERRRKWAATIIILALLLLLNVIAGAEVLIGFIVMLTQVVLISLLGGALGVGVGSLIFRGPWLTRAALRFLRIGMWVPFLASSALQMVWLVGLAAVTLAACYYYLASRFILGLDWRNARPQVLRSTILQAFFISFISQVWDPQGFKWFVITEPGWVFVGYATLILVLVFLVIVDLVFPSSFDQTSTIRGTILWREMAAINAKSIYGAFLLWIACLVFWQLLSAAGLYPLISSPPDTLTMVYRLLITADTLILKDIGVSLLELFEGLVVGGLGALIISKALGTNETFRRWMLSLLPLTYVVPFVFSLFIMHWIGGYTGPWRIALGAGFLTFFPFIQAMWGLQEHRLACRVLIAVDEALPFAFVAMLFGETINAVTGLGFFTVVARASLKVDQAIATSMITLALFILLSAMLRGLAKRLYFPPALAASNSTAQPLFPAKNSPYS
jgi:ABC-type nitrate/sulfonate/bicarbonate transport system permease component